MKRLRMKRLTLRERGRIYRLHPGRKNSGGATNGNPDVCWLDSRLFDRLMDYDRSRDDGGIFDWRIDEARAGQWVGVVQIPGLLLELLPKIDSLSVPVSESGSDFSGSSNEGAETGRENGFASEVSLARDNLLVMLGEISAVPLRLRDLADLGTRKAPLHEVLIALFAKSLRFELLRGSDRGYINEVDDLRVMRGKLLIGRHLARNTARRERFTCAFDDFTADTSLSRVLKASCQVLMDRSLRGETREALNHCLLLLDDVSEVFDPRPLLGRVVITRQNERFSELFTFARLVLEQLSPSSESGDNSVFSLLFDMDRIFEDFIASMLRRAARQISKEIRVFPQAKGRGRFLMDGELGGVMALRPDVLVEWGESGLVVDTKWKRLGPVTRQRQAGLSASDLQQLYAYTRRFGVKRSVLLFPHVPGAVERDFWPLGAAGEKDGSQVVLRFVRLHRNLRRRTEFRALVDELAELIDENLELESHAEWAKENVNA